MVMVDFLHKLRQEGYRNIIKYGVVFYEVKNEAI